MRRADFSYELPRELIATRPLPDRGASRLLALDGATGRLRDLAFQDLGSLLRPRDVLVLNDTRVLPARLRGRKASGGACEVLLERILGGPRFLAQARSSKGIRPGTRVELPANAVAVAVARHGSLVEFELDRDALTYFESEGDVPLPPYLARDAEPADRERYQTVYAAAPGAVAAPTAGLHFDDAALARLSAQGIAIAKLTLHVGAGTFMPMRADEIEAHRLHAERYRVPPEAVATIAAARRAGQYPASIPTTTETVRPESTAHSGGVAGNVGATSAAMAPSDDARTTPASPPAPESRAASSRN